jgi:hypothetical protein
MWQGQLCAVESRKFQVRVSVNVEVVVVVVLAPLE